MITLASEMRALSAQNDLVANVLIEIERKIETKAKMGETSIEWIFPQDMGRVGEQAVLTELSNAGYKWHTYREKWFISW